MVKKIDIPKDNNIIKVPLEEAMPDNYLPYAVEVAKDRALPDVRDGLKPVHRRILYGSYMLKAFPDKPYYKSARIVGDILGKYHPHGDSSVYDAMVILAQSFSTRMTLIDGHGNWGSMDGDSAAAMRYTEARLTPIALEMLRDIDKDVVDMVDNYSASELEPKVLPAKYPNILVNGAFGIAVGLATNIPPHNLREVIDASLAYIDNNDITTKELLCILKGPDLPTGGIIIGKNALLAAYETGEGKVTLRAKTNIETLENGRLGIVITEFPYRKNKAKMLQLISEMTGDKKHSKALEAITDIRDESDRTGIRAVIELKKSADKEMAEKVLKYLFKKTELQSNISFNLVAIADGKPQTLGLKMVLHYYLQHAKEVITRRTQKELEIAKRRFHIVEGFIKAIDIIDEIISTIRASKSKKDSEQNLMNKFGFTEIQAEAIVELMLYRLTGLEIKAFEKEHSELEKLIKRLTKILENEKELLKVIKNEMIEVRDKFGDDRRTEIIEDDSEAKIDIEELIVVEDVVITLSNEGYIKRLPQKNYARSNANAEDIDYREGDYLKYLLESNTRDSLVLFTDKGNMYQTKVVGIPEMKWKEKGEKIDTIIKGLDLIEESIIAVYSISNFAAQKDLLFVTDKAVIKKTQLDRFSTSYSKISALKLKNDEKLVNTAIIDRNKEEDFIQIKTNMGLQFTMEQPKLEAVDRNIIGTQLLNLSVSHKVTSVEYVETSEYKTFYIAISEKGLIKTVEKITAANKKDKYCAANSNSKVMIFLDDGTVVKIPALMLQNISLDGVQLEKLYDEFDNNKKVLGVTSFENFNSQEVYFFSKKGYVKRTEIKEFQGEYLSTAAYRIRGEDDKLIDVKFTLGEEVDILIVTQKAMCIRFKGSSISFMGKIASGVTGISLSEDDSVVYCGFIHDKLKQILLLAKDKQEKLISIEDIKVQNRAGRGKNLMLIVMGNYIKEVKEK
ncbi:MAG: DNA topoisomerase IV subunit A [Bacillota bacterium]|nr:DNA topoisomerase IV subunit A [Bacillota bacterium]